MSNQLYRKKLSRFFNKMGNKNHIMEQKLIVLEKKILRDWKRRQETNEDSLQNVVPIIIEQLFVEKIEVDKFDLNNNIGALGIRELAGRLNIGANYNGSTYEEGII